MKYMNYISHLAFQLVNKFLLHPATSQLKLLHFDCYDTSQFRDFRTIHLNNYYIPVTDCLFCCLSVHEWFVSVS